MRCFSPLHSLQPLEASKEQSEDPRYRNPSAEAGVENHRHLYVLVVRVELVEVGETRWNSLSLDVKLEQPQFFPEWPFSETTRPVDGCSGYTLQSPACKKR